MKVLLITPPFTQLNTPYPATTYLKGFLKQQGFAVFQTDLGIELINRMFSSEGLQRLFDEAGGSGVRLSRNAAKIIGNRQRYLRTVDPIMRYLQHRDSTLAHRICSETFLPKASRFDQLPDLEWSFGAMGVNEKARYLSTLYIEDIGDLIKEAISPHFGFSRYAESLGLSAHSFASIRAALQQPENCLEAWMLELLKGHIEQQRPDVIGITIPFPGNLYAGLKCGQFVKRSHPHAAVVMGGGFVNTELRQLSEPAVFDHVDFLTLDDGELPFLSILKFLDDRSRRAGMLKRTIMLANGQVRFFNDSQERDPSPVDAGCPDYSDLPLDKYLSLIEIANPMHRLWSDGRWNKMTIAHGCYWHQCSFCDTTLDYIRRFESAPARVLVDRIERIRDQTGQTGFHFVDEAAPPAALKELALELLRRELSISWWTNIRFERAFDRDLSRLLAASGCIAVSGGLEAASDRILKLMNKGVTVRQAAQACRSLREAGIMVHAYLMYGFPTQTARETVDSLEIVRQFFHEDLIESAYWHQFVATVHSDVGRHPENYGCAIRMPSAGAFARNDLVHEDPSGCDHHTYAPGLKKAVYNFMHGLGTDIPVNSWFDHKVPPVSIQKDHVRKAISEKPGSDNERMRSRVVWLENLPLSGPAAPAKRRSGAWTLEFTTATGAFSLSTTPGLGVWLGDLLSRTSVLQRTVMTLEGLKQEYEERFTSGFGAFLRSREWKVLRERGLLLV